MRHSIEGFQQKLLVELKCDASDVVLLRWFADFALTGRMKAITKDGLQLWWVRYQTVIEQLPILKIASSDVIGRRMKRLAEVGILTHETVTEGGTFSYYGFGPKWEALVGEYQAVLAEDQAPKRKTADKTERAPGVWITDKEHEDLVREHGAFRTEAAYKLLSDYQLANAKQYKSHAATIRYWVMKAVLKNELELNRGRPLPPPPKPRPSWKCTACGEDNTHNGTVCVNPRCPSHAKDAEDPEVYVGVNGVLGALVGAKRA